MAAMTGPFRGERGTRTAAGIFVTSLVFMYVCGWILTTGSNSLLMLAWFAALGVWSTAVAFASGFRVVLGLLSPQRPSRHQ